MAIRRKVLPVERVASAKILRHNWYDGLGKD